MIHHVFRLQFPNSNIGKRNRNIYKSALKIIRNFVFQFRLGTICYKKWMESLSLNL